MEFPNKVQNGISILTEIVGDLKVVEQVLQTRAAQLVEQSDNQLKEAERLENWSVLLQTRSTSLDTRQNELDLRDKQVANREQSLAGVTTISANRLNRIKQLEKNQEELVAEALAEKAVAKEERKKRITAESTLATCLADKAALELASAKA